MIPRRHTGPHRSQAGFTLIEMLVTLAVVVLLMGAAVVSYRSVQRARLRKAAVQLAASIRFAYDRAAATGRDFRLVFELGEHGSRYWLEVAPKAHARIGKTVERNRELEEEEREEQREEEDGTTAGGLDEALTLKRAAKPRWQKVRSRLAREVELPKGVRIAAVYLARLDEEVSEGRVTLYFWGQGQTERAVFWIRDREDREYTVIVHPLTGRARVVRGHYEPPEQVLRGDDEGEEVPER